MKSFKGMSFNRRYTIIPNEKQPEIADGFAAYEYLEKKKRWKKLCSVKEWKILALTSDKKLICEIAYLPGRKPLEEKDLPLMFEIVKKQGALKVFIVTNAPREEFIKEVPDYTFPRQIKECGTKNNIDVIDQMIADKYLCYRYTL